LVKCQSLWKLCWNAETCRENLIFLNLEKRRGVNILSFWTKFFLISRTKMPQHSYTLFYAYKFSASKHLFHKRFLCINCGSCHTQLVIFLLWTFLRHMLHARKIYSKFTDRKAVCRILMKLDPAVNSTNILQAAFVTKCFEQLCCT
jgi:hypothetical protein